MIEDLSHKESTNLQRLPPTHVGAIRAIFDYSKTWQLVIPDNDRSVSDVFVLQNPQRRDGRAVHAKLVE